MNFIIQLSNGRTLGELTITDAGQLNIGPFKFVIGDKEYKTDSLKINVSPKLPDDIKDGMWLRLAEFKGENFLIIEQRISNQWKREKHSEDETTMTHGDGVTYFELKKDILEKNGLEISRKSSGTHSEILDKNDFLGNGTVSFKIEIYKFKKTDNFKKRIRLDKNLFNNLPDKIKVDEIWIE